MKLGTGYKSKMKSLGLIVVLLHLALIQYGQIIADHTVVDRYDDIPQQWIDSVKKMFAVYPGESHAAAMPVALNQLETLDSRFQVITRTSGTPYSYRTNELRFSGATWGDFTNPTGWIYSCGEEDWFTNATGRARIKAGITYCNTNNLQLAAIGFGWCYDDSHSGSISSTVDPVYGCRWYGRSLESPSGSRSWGLDAGDQAITGNVVSLDTYLAATQEYIDYCLAQGYRTKVYFTTGPVEPTYYKGEAGYQASLKHQRIRDYVKADPTRILFDYADILCYDNGSTVMSTSTWNGHTFPVITPTNYGTGDLGHIDDIGALRLAKAMWWMLARIAGWDGGISATPVSGITVTGTGGATSIASDNGTLQLTATVAPSNATNKTVTWSIVNGTGQATISSTGLVTAVSNGTVTARATATDGSGVVGSLVITISSQVIPVTGITVMGTGGATSITSNNGTLQLTATVAPTNATNKTVTWSVVNGTGQATISSTGLVTAVSNGTVTARATANDGSGVVGSLVITISNQQIPVTGITVTGTGGATSITSDNGTLQLTATVTPADATNKTVTWSIVNGTGQATINPTGLVTAIANGTVTARATANDGSGVVGTLVITISSQVIPVTGITVTGASGATVITSDNGTLQLTATVAPTNATNNTVIWSVVNGTGQATISSSGLITALSNGTVTARATATDGSGVVGSLVITISNQQIPVTGITVTGTGGATSITSDNGTLQLTATVTPADATNKTVTWSVVNGTGQATINPTGLVTAIANGTVTARATANDGSGVVGTLVITISSQVIPVTGITVTGASGATVITSDNGTLQLTATVTPTDATNKTVTWSVVNGTGQATISSTGLVTAVANGTVTARATATDGSGVVGSLVITISNQVIPVTGITVMGTGGATSITSDNGTLQLTATVAPTNATNKTVTWSVVNGTGQATISSTGLVTAVANGTVTARATANDGSGVVGSLVIMISNQVIPVTGITVMGTGGATSITSDNGTLQLTATVAPPNATNKTVTWSVVNGTGQATISSTGLVTAVSNGTVTARATATDGSGVVGSLVITISSQVIPVTGITVTGTGGATSITSDNGTLQLTATVTPTDATNKTVTWSIVNGTGQATISSSGLVTAVASGMVTARATANDGGGIVGTLIITITGQSILVTRIDILSSKGESVITTQSGTLPLTASVQPANATNQTVTWSLINGTGQATISPSGLVTSVSNGTVTARATAADGSGIYGQLIITISNQFVAVAAISVTGSGGVTTIGSDDGTLQMVATVSPENATNKNITWTLAKGSGHATISETGLLTAKSNGIVTVRATSIADGSVFGEREITLANQIVKVSAIKVKPNSQSTDVVTVKGSIQLTAEIEPADATDQTVTWSVINSTGKAKINEKGLLVGEAPGDVTVVATAADGSGVEGEITVMIDLVESIHIRYTRNEIIIEVPDQLIPAKVSLHNLHGSLVQTKVLDTTECVIDISSMMPGIYVVSVYNSVVHDAAKIAISY